MDLYFNTLFPILLSNNNIGNNTEGEKKVKFPKKISWQLYGNNSHKYFTYNLLKIIMILTYNLEGHKI